MRVAWASSEFSTSSFTTLAGRSTTSPAAIWFATCSGSRRIRFTDVKRETLNVICKVRPQRKPAHFTFYEFVLREFRERQSEGKHRAALRLVTRPNASVMVLNNFFADGKPET